MIYFLHAARWVRHEHANHIINNKNPGLIENMTNIPDKNVYCDGQSNDGDQESSDEEKSGFQCDVCSVILSLIGVEAAPRNGVEHDECGRREKWHEPTVWSHFMGRAIVPGIS